MILQKDTLGINSTMLCSSGEIFLHFFVGSLKHMAFIEFNNITKTFGGTVALDDVSLSIDEGEVHVLMGENGAGKSTLGKVLAGIHRPDRGSMQINGTTARFASPRDARRRGIGMVHQEFALCPDLSVAENLSLGQYPARLGVWIDRRSMRKRAQTLLGEIGANLDPDAILRDLSIAQNQLVQIAAALSVGGRILVFDEPTSALTDTESAHLLELIRTLRGRGVTIIYISHRMSEVFAVGDRLSVLRDGKFIATVQRSEVAPDDIIQMMIGRRMEEYYPGHLDPPPGQEVLRVEHLSSPGKFEDVSFAVRKGEIVGIAGLVGSGRSDLVQAIFGLDRHATGIVRIDDTDISATSQRSRMTRGIGLVPEDRKKQGLALPLSCRMNFSLPLLDRIRTFIFLNHRAEQTLLDRHFQQLNIKAASYESSVANLSGGNQQKIIVARWLARGSRVLLLDEPTRGVDVGAKAAIHALIDTLARGGIAIVLISSELPEVIRLSTRILVMREGRVVGEVPRNEATQERLMMLMSGISRSPDGNSTDPQRLMETKV
jgi:ABC-type sugar transport system ATPase subunit